MEQNTPSLKDPTPLCEDPDSALLKESPSAASSPSFASPGPQVVLPVGVGTPLGVASPDAESTVPTNVLEDSNSNMYEDDDIEDGLQPLDLSGA